MQSINIVNIYFNQSDQRGRYYATFGAIFNTGSRDKRVRAADYVTEWIRTMIRTQSSPTGCE